MKNLLKISTLFIVLGLLTSCKPNDAKPKNDAIDLALADARFTVFTKLLTDNGLVETLKTGETFTVFAPTNEAFSKVDLSTFTKDELLKLLRTHIAIRNRLLTNEIKSGIVQSPSGILYLSKNSTGIFINGSQKIISPDILASNGVIQVIDKVIVPPTKNLAETIRENSDFSELLSWFSASDSPLEERFSNLSVYGSTILAPNNAAFQELYKTTPKATLLADKIKVNEVLRLHTIVGAIFSTDFPNLLNQPVDTRNTPEFMISTTTVLAGSTGGGFTRGIYKGQYQVLFDLANGTKVKGIESGSANITGVNLYTKNGVIHTLDKVLIP